MKKKVSAMDSDNPRTAKDVKVNCPKCDRIFKIYYVRPDSIFECICKNIIAIGGK